ncbi:MAG: MFS transporter [Candidatus Thorarchaeota archaeon]
MARTSYAVLLACVLAHFMNHLYTGILTPFYPSLNGINGIYDDLQIELTQVGLITSAAIITMTLLHLGIGYLGDKGWREIFIPVSILVPSIVVLFMGFANGLLFLIISQIALGFGVSPHHPSAFPVLAERFPGNTRARAVGIHAAGGLVGMVVTPFLGGALFAILQSWRFSLIVVAVLGFVILVPVVILFRYASSSEHTEIIHTPVEEVTSDEPIVWSRGFKLIVIFIALRGIPFRCVTLLMPTYLFLKYGQNALEAATLTTIMLAFGLVAEMVFAPISDRTGKRVPFMVASIGLTVPILYMLNLPLNQTELLFVLIGFGFFFFMGVPAGQAYETEIVPVKSRGLAFGIIFSLGALPGATAPLFFGAIGDTFGLPAAILFLVITSSVATLIALLLRDDDRVGNEQVVVRFDTPQK